MEEDRNKKYTMSINNNTLTFRTSSYKAEKRSVLHGDVYSREFSALLLSAGPAFLGYIFCVYPETGSMPVRYLVPMTLFISTFIFSRKYIFKERCLEMKFDKTDNTATIVKNGLLCKKHEKMALTDITGIELGSRQYVPENLDGIEFVQKISAQHGSAVPHLDKPEEYITLSLRLSDNSSRTIYAANIENKPDIPLNGIRNFLNIQTDNRDRGTPNA